jgi:hypothetical protein
MWHIRGGGFSFHCSIYKTRTMSVARRLGLFCVASSKTTTMNATCHPNFFLLKHLEPQQQATLIVMVFSFIVWPRRPRQGTMVVVLIFLCVVGSKTTTMNYFHFHGFFLLHIL